MSTGKRPVRVAFLHPDLGIGGAERLIVDAAVGLQNLKDDAGERAPSLMSPRLPCSAPPLFPSQVLRCTT
jgi:hypothetical protein